MALGPQTGKPLLRGRLLSKRQRSPKCLGLEQQGCEPLLAKSKVARQVCDLWNATTEQDLIPIEAQLTLHRCAIRVVEGNLQGQVESCLAFGLGSFCQAREHVPYWAAVHRVHHGLQPGLKMALELQDGGVGHEVCDAGGYIREGRLAESGLTTADGHTGPVEQHLRKDPLHGGPVRREDQCLVLGFETNAKLTIARLLKRKAIGVTSEHEVTGYRPARAEGRLKPVSCVLSDLSRQIG